MALTEVTGDTEELHHFLCIPCDLCGRFGFTCSLKCTLDRPNWYERRRQPSTCIGIKTKARTCAGAFVVGIGPGQPFPFVTLRGIDKSSSSGRWMSKGETRTISRPFRIAIGRL
jgi:hypothetical protein